MTTTSVTKSRSVLVKVGGETYALALVHRSELEPRLPVGMIDELGVDVSVLGGPPAPPAAPPLGDALQRASKLLTAAHDAVRAGKPSVEAAQAYGLRSGGAGKNIKATLAALDKVITRCTAQPGEAASFGIVPADVAAMGGARSELQAAEAAHTQASAKLTTVERKAAEARIRTAINRIKGAGVMAFALDATGIRASFEAIPRG